ncbi:hypothetical protein [Adlercreutzia sp. ZJ473]|uniref:dimethyl sulfoxide reductase anchor subunit family protein n=1 Tax=Adlercreutzia sp. ZJ473 TaxID=2722822 RepID=UPI00155168C4|nr:hypothetical protein [Adlercreutzia sp. ZJ473]
MEMQWPLILFTAFVAWSAGLFGTQSVLAVMGKAKKAQMPMLITSAALLVIGGVAVFFHLEHWERIFNGFGHLSSGITQELIAIVVLAIVMVVFFVMLRKGAGGEVPRALAIVGIVVAVALVCVAGASYLMPARPTWNSITEVLSLVGNACAFGPLTALLIMTLVDSADGEGISATARIALVGTVANAVTTIIFLIVMVIADGSLTDVGYYFDPTHPTHAMQTVAAANPFAGGSAVTAVVAIIGAAAAAALALVGSKKPAPTAKVLAIAALACALIGAVTLRMAFYASGLSMFMFF